MGDRRPLVREEIAHHAIQRGLEDPVGAVGQRRLEATDQLVLPAGARLVHTAGACPIDEHDRVVALGDVAGQARQVMDNLEVALQAAGAALTDVVRTTVYVASTDQADLVTAWNVVRARFGDHDAPSTLLGVTVLGYRGQLVEVDAVAVTK